MRASTATPQLRHDPEGTVAAMIYETRRKPNGQPPYGECQVLAAMIAIAIPDAVPVGGICHGEDSGSHWWYEMPGGRVLDPLGADWIGGGIITRDKKVPGVAALLSAMRASWSDSPEIMRLAQGLKARRAIGRLS